MARQWSEILGDKGYQSLSPELQALTQETYFKDVIAPALPEHLHAAALDRFNEITNSYAPPPTDQSSALGNAGRLLKTGANMAAQDVRELVGKIPLVGKPIQSGLDWVDEKTHGGVSSDELLKKDNEAMQSGLGSGMKEALDKKWWDQEKGTLGNAWSDPRAYEAGVLQSLPEQALMMFPAMRMAKGAFAAKEAAGIASGLSEVEAAAAASKTAANTAQIAGTVIEGGLGGAQSSRQVRDEILDPSKVTDAMLSKSDAYQSLLNQGMDATQARKTLADDRAAHAFITAGVATGIFGGMGDRFLAKIITGTGHGAAARFAMGGVSEGLAEELPQSYLQQVAQNEAIRGANPDQSLTDDALNQGLQGMATGGIQGGGMASVFGHATSKPNIMPGSEPDKKEPTDNTQPDPRITDPNASLDKSISAFNESVAPQRDFGMLSQGATGFGKVNELADLVDQEKADLAQRRGGLISAQQQGNALLMDSNIESTDNRVAGAQAEETRAARLKLLDDTYSNQKERSPGMTFLTQLEANFPHNPNPTAEEKQIIAKRESAHQAFRATEQTQPDEVAQAQAKPNAPRTPEAQIAQVDEFLSNGYSPISGGKMLANAKGKKLLLTVAQREYVKNKPPQEPTHGTETAQAVQAETQLPTQPVPADAVTQYDTPVVSNTIAPDSGQPTVNSDLATTTASTLPSEATSNPPTTPQAGTIKMLSDGRHAAIGFTPEQLRAADQKVFIDAKGNGIFPAKTNKIQLERALGISTIPEGTILADGDVPFAKMKQANLVRATTQGMNKTHKVIPLEGGGYGIAPRIAEAKGEVERVGESILHKEAGEPAEAATPAAVEKSLAKGDANSKLTLAQMKNRLIGEVDAAIAAVKPTHEHVEYNEMRSKGVPNAREFSKAWTYQQANNEYDQRINALRDAIGYVNFDVPGDGKFKVLNTPDNLASFKEKIGGAFKPAPKQRAETRAPLDRPAGEMSPQAYINQVSKDNHATAEDLQNAIEVAGMHNIDTSELVKRHGELAVMEAKARELGVDTDGKTHRKIANEISDAEAKPAQEASAQHGSVKPFSDVRPYLVSNVFGKEKGEEVPDARFAVGTLPADTIAEIGKFIDGFSDKFALVRISGRTLKHTDEQRHAELDSVIDSLPQIIEGKAEVLHNPTRDDSALVVYESDKNYLVVLEVAKNGNGTDVVNIITTRDRGLKQYRKKSAEWLDGRRSHHPVNPKIPAEGEISVFQPSGRDNVPQPTAESKSANTAQAKKLEVLKAQAQGKISGDQGAALKELADAGEHAAVDEVLNPSQPAQAASVEDAHNTEDAGAELTYNKRNRMTRGIKWEDIADKNESLRVKEVTKAKVYPKPDYEAMISDKGVALFSRAKSGRGMSVDSVESISAPIAEKLKNIRTVKVVARQNEIPGLKEQVSAAFSRFQFAKMLAEKRPTQKNKERASKHLDKYLAVAKDNIEGAYSNGKLYLVASHLGSAERVQEVLRHEVAHLSVEQMLEEVKPGLYDNLLNNVIVMDKAGNKYIRELAAAVDKSQPGLDKKTRAAEIIAQIAERGDHEKDMPNVIRTLWQRISDGIKAFYKLVFDDTLNDQDVRDIVAQSFRWARGEGDAVRVIGEMDNAVKASRGKQSPESFARMMLEEFTAENDPAFTHKVSISKDLATVLEDVAGAEYHGEHTLADERSETGADHRYIFTTETGAQFKVFETDAGRVWIDVLGVEAGEGGQAIYAAVANYAYNTRKVFAGDPAGLSKSAIYRRTSNMLSSALRFGTTRHLDAAKEQIDGDVDNGIEPLNWRGSDVDKIEELAHSFVTTTFNRAPELNAYHFDFQMGRFTDSQGRPVGDDALAGKIARTKRIGTATARRAVFLESLISSGSKGIGERSAILERVLSWGDSSSPKSLDRLFSRAPEQSSTPSAATLPPRTTIIGDSGRVYTPAQIAANLRTGSTVTKKTLQERVSALWADAGKKMAQGLVDQFRPVRDISEQAYALMRLSKGATGAFEAFMQHGKLSIRDGAFDADISGGVIQKVFVPLGRETTDFLRWVAGNRAERLAKEGKENLFTPEDIAAFKSLSEGKTEFDYTLIDGTVTRDRARIYTDSLVKFNGFNKNVLDMAEQSGLIDGESRRIWESEFYVPFYRVTDEENGGVRGMNIKGGVVRQQAFQKLKGGEQQLNDLLDNTLMNWAHLIDASAKNRAAMATLKAAEKVGAARKALPGEKKTVWFMDNGQKTEYKVEDPYLMEAISSLEYAGLRGGVMDAMSTMKHVLTMGVTASPFFKVRNLIRDSVQSIATADLSYNPLENIKKGYQLTDRSTQEYVSAMAGGGLIRFGTMLEGSEAARTRQLIKQGSKDTHILDNESKVRAFYDKYVEPGISAYNELGNRGEEINRMALYDRLIKQGVDHATASLMARDLMDFSMQGTWQSVRFLTQVVPFMNARLQGLYKLGRASQADKARFAIVLGATAMASLALLAAYGDDDDWMQREDWDRDNYWWFKIDDTPWVDEKGVHHRGHAFRIPKPFEIGAIATLAERSAELMFDKEMTGKRFAGLAISNASNQLSFNPTPQLFKPLIDLYANKSSFTGRDIESMGMERLAPDYRFSQSTSMIARGISTAGNTLTGDHFLSPVQIDHITRAYFGGLGSFAVIAADAAIRSVSSVPSKPSTDWAKALSGTMISDLNGAHSRYVSQMYDQARELEQAYGTWRHLQKEGKTSEAQQFRVDHQEELSKYRRVEQVKRQAAIINERIRMIERSNLDSDVKRDKLNELRSRQDKVARQLVG